MNAWLSAPRRSFSFSMAGKVLKIQGSAAMGSGHVASVRKTILQRAKARGHSQRRLRPPPAYLSLFFQKDLEDGG